MKALIPLEIVVPILASISCLFAAPQLGLPIWALFIGWAWYYALGANINVFKQVYPAAIPGAVLAAICIWLISIFAQLMSAMLAMMIAVIITVFLLMCVLRIPLTSCGLSAFNSYSCVFATYYGGFYRQTGTLEQDILMALIYASVAFALGPVFGYFSIKLTLPMQENEEKKFKVFSKR
ncbi:DUF1097 domain-containing protein [Desulfoscipio gibsoniae]|uniref:DUF1097 domain-containing protein n=1 Tax=Desulfoscipio gibsoniae DSM 7213 TaxID=767817 RepID=R4KG61_9FIRM|nr:DUF1097 domain-containing protein [Desulfoscipio gibsoniae]AGL02208.1 Protein of unknown function (DUF1097) [Desulfoscipio gibsoniae DSM 7213]